MLSTLAESGLAVVVCHTDGKWSDSSAATECTRITTTATTTTTTATTATAASKKLAMKVEDHSTTLSAGYVGRKALDGDCSTYWQSCQGTRCITSQ